MQHKWTSHFKIKMIIYFLLIHLISLACTVNAQCGIFSTQTCWNANQIMMHPKTQVTIKASKGPIRIAVVGAGAGGASFSYYVSQAYPSASIDVFESDTRPGGRCMSERLVISEKLNISILVEVGASIFVKENVNLYESAQMFNLTMEDEDERRSRAANGGRGYFNAGQTSTELNNVIVWNGTDTLFEMSVNGGWRSKIKGFLRYKFGALTTGRLANTAASKLSSVYEKDLRGYKNWPAMVESLGLKGETNVFAAEYAVDNKINTQFVDEVFETVTRVNYGRNLDEIHSLAALIGFVDGPTYSIQGGNQQIFEAYLRHSKSHVQYATKVNSIKQVGSNAVGYRLTVTNANQTMDLPTVYDLVVLAIPPHAIQSVQLPATARKVHPVTYHHIHVTFILGKLNLSTFPSRPAQILTAKSVAHIQSIALVWDFGYELLDYGLGLYKVFSTVPFNQLNATLVFSQVRQVYPRQWLSYPIMQPESSQTSFYPPIVLHRAPVAGGIYYLNGIERFISTMETATIAARNLVRVLLCEYDPGQCVYTKE